MAHWRLAEPEGTTGAGSVADSAGGHDGGLPGAPFAPGQPGATPQTDTSIAFSNASIDVPYDPILNPESITVTAWARPENSAGFQSVFTNRNDIGPGVQVEGAILYLDDAGNWSFWTGAGGPIWPGLVGPAVRVGEWQHLAISYDAETVTKRLYVDGVEVTSSSDQGYVPNTLRDLHIGGGGGLRVLDVGCGNGDLLAALQPSEGVGLDLSARAVGAARQRHGGGDRCGSGRATRPTRARWPRPAARSTWCCWSTS